MQTQLKLSYNESAKKAGKEQILEYLILNLNEDREGYREKLTSMLVLVMDLK